MGENECKVRSSLIERSISHNILPLANILSLLTVQIHVYKDFASTLQIILQFHLYYTCRFSPLFIFKRGGYVENHFEIILSLELHPEVIR